MTSYKDRGMNTLGYAAIALVTVVILAGIVYAAITYNGSYEVTGSGVVITREFNLTGFSAIQVGGGFRVNVTHSDIYSIRVITDDNIMERLSVSSSGGTLTVQFKPGTSIMNPTTLRAEITMPVLSAVDLSGGTRGNVLGFLSLNQTRFQTFLSGGSLLDIPLINVDSFSSSLSGGSILSGTINSVGTTGSNLILSGGSRANLSGTSGDITIDASGASVVEMLAMYAHDINIIMSGGGVARINLDGRLDAVLSGGSVVRYAGTPTMGNIILSGGATVAPV